MKIIKILSFLAVAALLSGAECAFVASSGGSSTDREEEQRSNLVVIIRDGQLVDGPVEGVRFESGSQSGFTGPNGEFRFEDGGTVRFSIGDIVLGERVAARSLMSPVDLVPGATLNSDKVTNIARLLQSLDAVPGDERITIPDRLHTRASILNPDIGSTISLLDFSDNDVFASSGSQLVATLTEDYPFTTTLVSAASAQSHMQTTLRSFGLIDSR